MKFCFLAGVEACHPDELRWYYDLEDIEPNLYLCMSFLGMAEGGFQEPLDDTSVSIEEFSGGTTISEVKHSNDIEQVDDTLVEADSITDVEDSPNRDSIAAEQPLLDIAENTI